MNIKTANKCIILISFFKIKLKITVSIWNITLILLICQLNNVKVDSAAGC